MTSAPRLSDLIASQVGSEQIEDMTAVCPSCGGYCSFTEVGRMPLKKAVLVPKWRTQRLLIAAKCRHCSICVLIASGMGADAVEKMNLIWPIETWPSRAPEELDEDVRRIYDESRRVVGLSPSAAATLTRRCLQYVIRKRMCIERKTLFLEIQEATKSDLLTANTKRALDHVREIGNYAAHPELDEALAVVEVSSSEATYTLEVLELLFHDLYEQPKRISSMEARLQLRNGSKTERVEGASAQPSPKT